MTKILVTIFNTDKEGFTQTERFIHKTFLPFEDGVREAILILENKVIRAEEFEFIDLTNIPELE